MVLNLVIRPHSLKGKCAYVWCEVLASPWLPKHLQGHTQILPEAGLIQVFLLDPTIEALLYVLVGASNTWTPVTDSSVLLCLEKKERGDCLCCSCSFHPSSFSSLFSLVLVQQKWNMCPWIICTYVVVIQGKKKKKQKKTHSLSHHRGEKRLSLVPLEEFFFCAVLAGRPKQLICGNEHWNILFKQAGASCEMFCRRLLVLHCYEQHVLDWAERDLLGFRVQ